MLLEKNVLQITVKIMGCFNFLQIKHFINPVTTDFTGTSNPVNNLVTSNLVIYSGNIIIEYKTFLHSLLFQYLAICVHEVVRSDTEKYCF